MKRLFAIALLAGMAASLGAVDLSGEFVMTNIGFPWSQTLPVPDGVSSFPFTNFLYGGAASIKQSLSDNLELETAYALDPLQRSNFKAMVNYDTGVLHIGIGPSFGIFNNSLYPMEAGFASSVKFEIPGVIFLTFRNESSIGPALGSIGENAQGFNEISVGWYVKNAICTASMASTSFQVQQAANWVTSDSSTDYSFLVDIFKKNQPFNVKLSMGYRTVSREYLIDGASMKDSLGIIILGTNFVLRPARFLELALGLDSGVYSFGFDRLLSRGPDMDTAYMFKAKIGLIIKTDKFDSSSGIVIDRGDPGSAGAAASATTPALNGGLVPTGPEGKVEAEDSGSETENAIDSSAGGTVEGSK
jgi:hypothetical protein